MDVHILVHFFEADPETGEGKPSKMKSVLLPLLFLVPGIMISSSWPATISLTDSN